MNPDTGKFYPEEELKKVQREFMIMNPGSEHPSTEWPIFLTGSVHKIRDEHGEEWDFKIVGVTNTRIYLELAKGKSSTGPRRSPSASPFSVLLSSRSRGGREEV